jgi:hypothetical protein
MYEKHPQRSQLLAFLLLKALFGGAIVIQRPGKASFPKCIHIVLNVLYPIIRRFLALKKGNTLSVRFPFHTLSQLIDLSHNAE